MESRIQKPVMVKINNKESYELLFPFELSNLDYVRRILDFLKEGLIIFVQYGIKINREMKEQYDKIESEGNHVNDSYYILKCLKDSHRSWIPQVGYSINDLYPSLSFLFNLRNSFSHQNKKVYCESGSKKTFERDTVLDAFNHSKKLLSICSMQVNNEIYFTIENLNNLEMQFYQHSSSKQQRMSLIREENKNSEREIQMKKEQEERERIERENIEREEKERQRYAEYLRKRQEEELKAKEDEEKKRAEDEIKKKRQAQFLKDIEEEKRRIQQENLRKKEEEERLSIERELRKKISWFEKTFESKQEVERKLQLRVSYELQRREQEKINIEKQRREQELERIREQYTPYSLLSDEEKLRRPGFDYQLFHRYVLYKHLQ